MTVGWGAYPGPENGLCARLEGKNGQTYSLSNRDIGIES